MKEIYSAFVKAQKAFGPALKSSTNPHFKNKYAALDKCVEAVMDALNDNGIALIQKTHQDDSGVTVETTFIHESGEAMSAGTLHFPASKHDAQGFMSALTYCRRGSLMAACGIAPEDDDGNAASKPTVKKISAVAGSPNDYQMNEEEQQWLMEGVQYLKDCYSAGAIDDAKNWLRTANLDDVQHTFLWANLDSKIRTAIDGQRKKAA